MTSSPTSAPGSNSLSDHVFVAIISSVGSIVLILGIIMICVFAYLCYSELRKRRSQIQKHSDRVGLLRSRAEEEEITSDQETAMSGVQQEPKDTATCAAPPKQSPPLLASSKVCPEPSPPSSGTRHRKGGKPHKEQQEEEDVSYTMIGDSEHETEGDSKATFGDQHSYAELDDDGDKAQLIKTVEKKSVPKAKAVDLNAMAALLGRSIAYVEQLNKSCPLDAETLTALSVGKIIAQYKSVPTNSVDLPNQSQAERAKNRYRNVLPNPHSAVTLQYTGIEGSTYINGNFIRGLNGQQKQYIATQGPTFDTMADFWRLVWENNVSMIVMLTNLIEHGRHKCVKYWPPANERDTIQYGDIEVTKVEEDHVPSSYTLSGLSVRHLKTGEKREVYHYWCIAWPDFGIPKVAEPILKLRKAVDLRRSGSSNPGPVLVHCSAGLGRSGTFIAIDMGIQQYHEEHVVDPLKYLCYMRQDRGGMIQTQDQYAFVHQALAEYTLY